jgi:Na+/melibiose symporter-like transporter
MTDIDDPIARLPFTRLGLVRINLYWLALSGLWAAIAIQMAPVIGTHLICPAGTDGAACALLPLGQLTPLVGDFRVRPEVALGFMGLVGAVVAFVVQPISAALSDSTRTRFGRRRPWILVGTTLDVLFLLGLSMSQTFLAFAILGWLLQLSSNLSQGPYQAYVPDMVPEHQVGIASGLVAVMQTVGQLVGAAIGGLAVWLGDPRLGFIALAVLLIATMLPSVLRVNDRPVAMPPRTGSRLDAVRTALGEAWAYRSFVWLLVSRLFILMGTATLVATAEFFLTRSLAYSEQEAASAILVLLILSAVSAATAAAWAGGASDRLGRRRVIWLGCAISATGMVIIASGSAQPELGVGGLRFPLAGLGAVPVGIGAGMFLAADWALLVDIIPKATAGRYLGISNFVTASAGAVAATIAGLVIANATDLTSDAALGPRVAVCAALAWYAIGALALRSVDPTSSGAPALAASTP